MTAEEERILAWTLLGEAANQGRRGMEAVAFVIRNRTASGRFPSNPASVALQPGQFSTWNALSNGGNIPRARYSADSSIFQTALGAVRKVFSVSPGSDPTQGATHYYAPRGMPGEAAPYWWRSESSRAGDVRIGGHIFAAKYAPKVAPIPEKRPNGMDPGGGFPSQKQLDFVRTGQAVKLPDISVAYDPIRKEVVRTGSTATAKANVEAQRKEQQTQRATAVKSGVTKTAAQAGQVALPAGVRPVTPKLTADIPQSQIERSPKNNRSNVAGFSVPGGTSGIAVVDAERQLAANAKTEARLDELRANQSNVERGTPRVQTKFANVAQPNGSLLERKDETRLASPKGLPEVGAGTVPVAADAPAMPRPRPIRAPVVVPTVQQQPVPAARKMIEITVHAAKAPTVAKALATTPVNTLRVQGLSAADAYEQANANAAAAAAAGGKYSRGGGGSNNSDAASRVNGR